MRQLALQPTLCEPSPRLPCRHVAAFWTKSPPTTLDSPGLTAPMRKARSQNSAACPHRLRHASELSLRAICEPAATRLRQPCHRDHGPVTLPRPGVPLAAAGFPPHFRNHAPPPTAPRSDAAVTVGDCANLPPPTPADSPCHHGEPTPSALPAHPLRHSGLKGVRWRAPVL